MPKKNSGLNYEINKCENRNVIFFDNPTKTFDEILKIIENNIKPDFKSKIEVTSWTTAFIFHKNEIKIYFENYDYKGDYHFSFELFPIGSSNKADFKKMKEIIDDLSPLI